MHLLLKTPEVSSWEHFESQHQQTEQYWDVGLFLTMLAHI